jgi:UDP-N-acetylglucosamine 2-epimerase (non-hydrolysing)
MKILIVVGARPNFMKAAPILKAIREFNAHRGEWAEPITPFLVHTGQHYGAQMSDAFFSDLDLPTPDAFLDVGSGSHSEQTAEIMKRFEPVLLREAPDALLVVGDVNSTLACALVAAKLPIKVRPVIAHVEAGLRSFDRSMPEEINRILTDQLSDLLFVTEDRALNNLRLEGIPGSRVHFVGNTMIDSLREYAPRAEFSPVLERLGLSRGEYALMTLHRPGNVDDRDSLLEIFEGLNELAVSRRILFPAHPRTRKQVREFGLENYFREPNIAANGNRKSSGIEIVDPQGYLDFLCLMKHTRIVITDSGGIQEETTALGVPCVTVRENTERPVTVQLGTNILAGTRRDGIRGAIRSQLAAKRSARIPELWDGRAAARIVGILAERLSSRNSLPPTSSAEADKCGKMPDNEHARELNAAGLARSAGAD